MKVLKIAAMATVAFALGACDGSDSGTSAGPISAEAARASFVALPDSDASAAAQALVGGDVDAAIAATRGILQRGRVRVLTDTQLLGFAFDGRRRAHQYRLDSAQLAQMLKSLGFPFRDRSEWSQADRDEGMAGQVDREAEPDFSAELDAFEAARYADVEARRDAAEARHRAERDAITRPAEERREETARVRDAIYKEQLALPRDQRHTVAERLAAATRERDEARTAATEARARARELDERYHAARDLDDDRIARNIGGQIGPDHAAGQQLMLFLRDWVREAAKQPESPESFTPLFLAEMARRQGTPVDLAAETPAEPEQHRWSLVELALFAAAFRPDPPAESAAVGWLGDLLVPAARADARACDVAKEAWGDWGDVAEVAVGETTGAVVGEGAERALGELGGERFGQVLGAVTILGKVVKLAAFYANAQVTVESDQDGVLHKPEYYWDPVVFTATAGVSPEELEAYEKLSEKVKGLDKEVRTCLGFMGLPTIDTISEVAKDAENWLIDWRLYGNGHATWARDENGDAKLLGNGRVAKPMKRVSPSSAESRFTIRVLRERGHRGAIGHGKVHVRAEVDSSSMPSLGTLVNAGKGPLAIADAVTEIASGWIRVVFKPKSDSVVDVEFHCKDPTTIHRYVENPVADGRGELEPGCTFGFDSREDFEAWQEEFYPDA